jgi:hypothetical protein
MFKNYYGFISLVIILIIIILLPLGTIIPKRGCCNKEGFKTEQPNNYTNKYFANYHLLNSYPNNKTTIIDNDNYSRNWIYYPIFPLGSFEQITNNLKFFKNPDEGTCTPAELCGDFYHNKNIYPDTNFSKPLPPVSDESGIRVNYYRTKNNLFLSDQPGPVDELPVF